MAASAACARRAGVRRVGRSWRTCRGVRARAAPGADGEEGSEGWISRQLDRSYFPVSGVEVLVYSLRTRDPQGVLWACSPALVAVCGPVSMVLVLGLVSTGHFGLLPEPLRPLEAAAFPLLALGVYAEGSKFLDAVVGTEARRRM